MNTNPPTFRRIPWFSIRYTILLPSCMMILYYYYTYRITTKEYKNDDSTRSVTACQYYMAESTIPNAGWGLFTTAPIHINDPIHLSNGELAIHVVDLTSDHGQYLHTLYMNYMWNSDVTGSPNEGGGRFKDDDDVHLKNNPPGNVLAIISGIGILANGHPFDFNIAPYQISIPHPPVRPSSIHHPQPEVLLTRYNSPTAGTMTYHHHLPYFAHKLDTTLKQMQNREVIVPTGGELFINYCTGWSKRYDFHQHRLNVFQQNRRSVSYLQQYGYCIDNIQSSYPHGSVHNPQAGYGAIATRNIELGTVITPVPVIPIHRNGLRMDDPNHENNDNDSDSTTRQQQQQKQQLLLNYCYGHVQSNVLLVPYGPGIQYVNHNATNPNARVQWSTNVTRHGNRYHWIQDPEQVSYETMLRDQPAGILLLELVAIRDIEIGDEITIHYGVAWEQAYEHYQQHVWKPPPSNKNEYVYAYDMNQSSNSTVLRTEKEQVLDPYPKNLQLECYYVPHVWKELTNTGVSDGATSTTTTRYEWLTENHDAITMNEYHPNLLRPCRILERDTTRDIHKNTVLYKVEMIMSWNSNDHQQSSTRWIQIQNVPRHAIQFRDVVYTQDQYSIPNVFRHEIQLPDFPNHWKDIG